MLTVRLGRRYMRMYRLHALHACRQACSLAVGLPPAASPSADEAAWAAPVVLQDRSARSSASCARAAKELGVGKGGRQDFPHVRPTT